MDLFTEETLNFSYWYPRFHIFSDDHVVFKETRRIGFETSFRSIFFKSPAPCLKLFVELTCCFGWFDNSFDKHSVIFDILAWLHNFVWNKTRIPDSQVFFNWRTVEHDLDVRKRAIGAQLVRSVILVFALIDKIKCYFLLEGPVQ